MEIQYYQRAADFLSRTGSYLSQDEARYGLILGLARILVTDPHRYGQDDPWFCSIGTAKEINAAAMRTPPYMMIVAHFSGDKEVIADNLLTAVSGNFQAVPGVVGDKELADGFAGRWCDKHGTAIQHTQAQRIFWLVKVNEVPLSPGRLRRANEADTELVEQWGHAFYRDAFGPEYNEPENDIAPRVARGEVYLWEDGQPVSMAIKSRPTEKGMTVTGVYTPRELRRQGYATSCVAEISRHILQSGYQFCTLYTDLANPTSNSIYKKIGYQEVADSVEHWFASPAND